jgi:hypothetical protein
MAYYDYIRIYGAQESPLECLQGLGAAALYNKETDQPQSGGQLSPQEETEEQASFAKVWSIQNEWIDAEIERLNAMLGLLEKAETLVPPEMSNDEQTRGIWNNIITKASAYASATLPVVGQIAAFVGVVSDANIIGEFAYDIYKRFWVERETLRNLPAALIKLCKMTIDLLRKVRDLPQTEENFVMRQQMATQLTERFEQQLQFYMVGQNQYTLPSTFAGGMEQLTQALEQLAYSDNDVDLAGVRVSMRSQVITAG